MSSASVHPKKYLLSNILGRIIEYRGMVTCVKIWSRLFSGRHGIIWLAIFGYFEKLRENLNMHFKDDPISDMHARNYLIILCLKHFPGPTKFGPVFWSRLFRCGPVEYNYPNWTNGLYRTEPTEIPDCCGTGFYLLHRTEPTNAICTAYFIIISFHFIKLITYDSRFYLFKYHLLSLGS